MEINTKLTVDNINVDVIRAKELFAEKSNIKIDVDQEVIEGSTNAVAGGAVYTELKSAGKVKTVNGEEPDENGNIKINVVKTVNGLSSDLSGNVTLPVDDVIDFESPNPIQNMVISKRIQKDQDLYFDILERNTGLIFIKNVDDLLKLKTWVDDGEETSAKYYLQVQDIDLSGIPWEGIGLYNDNETETKNFRGTYNGGGFKITNLKFKTPCDDVGFFGCVGHGATLKNMDITLDDDGFDKGKFTSVNSDYKTKTELFNNVPVGDPNTLYWVTEDTEQKYSVWYWNEDKFEKYNMGAGVLVGYAIDDVIVENVKTHGKLGSEKLPGSHNCSGMIIGTTNRAKILLDKQQKHSGLVMNNCESNVDIVGAYTKNAGILAYCMNPTFMDNCVNNGTISSVYVAQTADSGGTGGIIGFDGYHAGDIPDHKVWFTNVLANGKVTGKITIEDLVKHNIGGGQQGHGSVSGAGLQYPQDPFDVKYRNDQIASFNNSKVGFSVTTGDGMLKPATTLSPECEVIQTCELYKAETPGASRSLRITDKTSPIVIDRSITNNTCVTWQDADKNLNFAEEEDMGDNKTKYYI